MTSSNEELYKDFLVDINPNRIDPALGSLERQIDAIDDRISKIIDKFQINGHPIMQPLLQMVNDPDEIPGFAKGLDRAGSLLKTRQILEKRVSALKALKETPQWFIGELNDFSDDIETLLSSLTEGTE